MYAQAVQSVRSVKKTDHKPWSIQALRSSTLPSYSSASLRDLGSLVDSIDLKGEQAMKFWDTTINPMSSLTLDFTSGIP
jgi:hypothetical protein